MTTRAIPADERFVVRVDCKCGWSVLIDSRPYSLDNCPRCGGEAHRTMTALLLTGLRN